MYAGDRLYNDVIRSKMAELATKVKAREIVAHLSCLTVSDQEEVEAKRESAGNYSAMMVLLDNLRRRENWPDHFITALWACEQRTLAYEISEAYDRIRGIHTQRETTATSAPHTPAAASVSLAACSSPAPSTAASVSPAACSPPAPSTAASVSPAACSPPAPSTAASVSPAACSPPAPSTAASVSPAACSPPAPSTAAAPSPAPAEASSTVTTVTIHSVPHSTPPLLIPSVEDSLSPSLRNSPPMPHQNKATPASTEVPALVSAPDAPIHPSYESPQPAEPPVLVLAPKETSSFGQSKPPVSSEGTPTLEISGGPINIALPGHFSAPTYTTNPTSTSFQANKPVTTSLSSASPEKVNVPVGEVESSSSVKQPVQETHPPGTVFPQDLQNNPTISQVVSRTHTAVSPTCQIQETTQESAKAPTNTENEGYFSKPGVLRSAEPYSVNSDRLQISCRTADSTPLQPTTPQSVSNHPKAEEPVNRSLSATSEEAMFISSTTTVPSQCDSESVDSVQSSTPRALGNGFSESENNCYDNQPVEDHYESLQTDPRTRVHIVQVSGEPSVQNLSGQPRNMVGSITVDHNGEADNLVQSVSEDASGQINIPQSEQREASEGVLSQVQSNAHLIAAAGLFLTTVFVALKYKR